MYEGAKKSRIRGDQTWQEKAACAHAIEVASDPDLFFPVTPADEGRIGSARKICSTCPVREACLESAMESGDVFGIRGGMTEDERKGIRHQFQLRCDGVRVAEALSGRDVYLTKAERRELIRKAAGSNASTLQVASVLKVSEPHAKKLVRLERRRSASLPGATQSGCEATVA
ncbi:MULTISPECIES: WhiB family transcriptional regulator [unclassified Streptomyces]